MCTASLNVVYVSRMSSGARTEIWLLTLLLAMAACDRRPTSDAASTGGGRPKTGAGADQSSTAVRADTPSSLPMPVVEACGLIATVLGRAKGAKVTRSLGLVEDESERRERAGCAVSIDGSFAALGGAQGPLIQLREELERRGWQEDTSRSADGPDGTRFAFVSGIVICLFGGQWDGGDDSDPSYRPDDRFTAWGRCAVLKD
jgi:hypothetical protein